MKKLTQQTTLATAGLVVSLLEPVNRWLRRKVPAEYQIGIGLLILGVTGAARALAPSLFAEYHIPYVDLVTVALGTTGTALSGFGFSSVQRQTIPDNKAKNAPSVDIMKVVKGGANGTS